MSKVLAHRKPLLVVAILLLALLVYGLWGPTLQVDGHRFDHGQNGLWLGHRWFDGRARADELTALVPQVRGAGIQDLYIHVGPLDAQGQIPAWSTPACRARLQALRQRLPGVRLLAWLGGVTTDLYGVAPDTVDLSSAAVRAAVAQTAASLVQPGLFDGLHYDLELIPNHSEGFVALLQATHVPFLSVATPILRAPWVAGWHLWSPAYLHEVASHCNQIAVMTYDTGMQTRTLYERLLAWQVPAICRAVDGTSCRVMLGVPTYVERSFIHNPKAENLDSALAGIAWGLSRSASVANFQGIAVYAQWTTTPTDWGNLAAHW